MTTPQSAPDLTPEAAPETPAESSPAATEPAPDVPAPPPTEPEAGPAPTEPTADASPPAPAETAPAQPPADPAPPAPAEAPPAQPPVDPAPPAPAEPARPVASEAASAPPTQTTARMPQRPRPMPPRRPVPRAPGAPAGQRSASPAPPQAPPAAPEAPSEHEVAARSWGRVADDGTVFVRTADGERQVGQMPDVPTDEALAFFTRRYADLVFEVELLERRIGAAALNPDEAAGSVKRVRSSVHEAHAVGDLAGLQARLDALAALVGEQREKRKAERARKQEQARARKEHIVTVAERLAEGSDWRNGANRLRQLLDDWKALPRLERSVDDTLWRRFSGARTTYTRRRKSHFSEVNEQRDNARAAKEKLVAEAETLSTSTDFGPTASRYRDLMTRWKAAGPAAKEVDDQLWRRFRAAQDAFFGARDASNAELDREQVSNAEVKERLLVEAEALLPVTDVRAAKEAFRRIADRWDEAGKVPRDRMKDLEGRMRKVEQAIRGIEDDRWRKSNPEARARAADTVTQLETLLADLARKRDAAASRGDTRKAEEHAAAIEARQAWLTEARRALQEFSG